MRFLQETMNFWRQTTHIMSYFKDENFRGDERLPKNFMDGFLEVRWNPPWDYSFLPSHGTNQVSKTGSQLGQERGG